ncbi:MAG: sulfite exporter TauE/SafE family protein [Gammaproteobacteria bacterium]|nr:sulfite exporter TauE/SafE family protein [Gammaproteobacteria bacterium]
MQTEANLLDRKPFAMRAMRWLLLAGGSILFMLVIWFGFISPSPDFYQPGFLLLGVIGAVFANSTGAGGGVVFIPVFQQMGFSEAQSVATSFGIQCFGMTAGAITWYLYYQRQRKIEPERWQEFKFIIIFGTLFSVLGIWHNYGMQLSAPAALHEIFSVFSVLLGLSILATTYLIRPGLTRHTLTKLDVLVLLVIAYAGGVITAWLSVGVGEIVAFYLIFRRFDVTLAVATAVAISALTVWSAALQHFWIDPHVNWQVVIFAGPGAVVGGVLARTLVGYMSARRLKIFFGIWLLIVGFAS